MARASESFALPSKCFQVFPIASAITGATLTTLTPLSMVSVAMIPFTPALNNFAMALFEKQDERRRQILHEPPDF